MQFKPKFFFLLIFLLVSIKTWGQVSLGDPVVNIDFGSNGSPKLPVTTYTYTTNTCPDDGSYSVGTSTSNCFGGAWHTVTHDHTGNPGGYMMIVNASYSAGEFFKQQTELGALCENTNYEFSAYILNLIRGDEQAIKPNISFIIETPEGVQLKKYDTGNIPLSASADGWLRYFTTFTTPPGVTVVVIKMVNNTVGGNGNDILLDDITFRAYGPIVQAGIAGNVSATQTSVCVGTAKNYTIKAGPPTGYANAKFQWQQNLNDGAGWQDITGEESLSLDRDFLANTPIGSYEYKLGVAEGSNISSLHCRVYSNAVTIDITGYPNPPELSPRSVCEGDVLTLTATGGASYKWTSPAGVTTFANPLVIQNAGAADAGPYHVEVISAAGCSTPQDVDVTVNLKPVINTNTNTPLFICRGDNTQLMASVADAGSYTYSWLPAAGLSDPTTANPMAGPDVSTLYTVTVTNAATNCSNTAQVQVTVNDLPVANAGADKKIFEGQSIKLDGSATGDILSYTWTPPDNLDDPHSPTPIASPIDDTPYTLTVVSDNGCGISESTVFVKVYKKIVIPTSFTPNNDGINDIWKIEALETYPQSTITVYTRGGKQVFQSRGYGKPWDGRSGGTPLPTGTYYYVIDLKNNTPNRSGWVLLVK